MVENIEAEEINEANKTAGIVKAIESVKKDEINEIGEISKADEFNELNEFTEADEFFEDDEIIVYGDSFIPLDKDAFMYILADIKKLRPVFDLIPVSRLKKWQATMVIDKTDIAIAALFSRDTDRFFQIVGLGSSYPSFTGNMAMLIDKNWKYMFANKKYYYSNKDRLSIRLSSNEINVVGWRRSQVSPVAEEPGVRMPAGFNEFRHRSGESAPLSLWFENHNSMLDKLFSNEGIIVNLPVDRFFLNLYNVDDKVFKVELILQINDFVSWKNFSIRSIPGKSDPAIEAIFFANPLIQNDRNVEFRSAFLSEEDITSLMKIFLKNWR